MYLKLILILILFDRCLNDQYCLNDPDDILSLSVHQNVLYEYTYQNVMNMYPFYKSVDTENQTTFYIGKRISSIEMNDGNIRQFISDAEMVSFATIRNNSQMLFLTKGDYYNLIYKTNGVYEVQERHVSKLSLISNYEFPVSVPVFLRQKSEYDVEFGLNTQTPGQPIIANGIKLMDYSICFFKKLSNELTISRPKHRCLPRVHLLIDNIINMTKSGFHHNNCLYLLYNDLILKINLTTLGVNESLVPIFKINEIFICEDRTDNNVPDVQYTVKVPDSNRFNSTEKPEQSFDIGSWIWIILTILILAIFILFCFCCGICSRKKYKQKRSDNSKTLSKPRSTSSSTSFVSKTIQTINNSKKPNRLFQKNIGNKTLKRIITKNYKFKFNNRGAI